MSLPANPPEAKALLIAAARGWPHISQGRLVGLPHGHVYLPRAGGLMVAPVSPLGRGHHYVSDVRNAEAVPASMLSDVGKSDSNSHLTPIDTPSNAY